MSILAASTAFWFSYVALWCLVAFFGLLLLLLFRQFGIAFMRPATRASLQGLDIGRKAPRIALDQTNGANGAVIFDPSDRTGATVVVFALPTCTVCDRLASDLANLPDARPGVDFIWVDGDSPQPAHQAVVDAPGWVTATAAGDRVHREWAVSAVPFGYVVGDDGRVKAKSLVNGASDIDALLGAAPNVPLIIQQVD